MPTDDEKIARFRAAFAAAKTPLVTAHRGGFLFQYEPKGPQELFPADVFEKMIENYEAHSHRFDNGVSLNDSGNGPVPPDDGA